VAPASKGTSQLIMPQQLQVIPLDVLLSAAQNSKSSHRTVAATQKRTTGAGSRRKVSAATNGTGKTARQAKTEDKPQKVIQPVTALLYHSALAMEQEQAEAKKLLKHAKPQQIIQPVTAFQFMAVLAKQQEQAEANQQKQPVALQQVQPAAKQQKQPVVKSARKPTAGKPTVPQAPTVIQSPPPQIPPAKPTRKRKPAVRKPVAKPPPVIPQPVVPHAPPHKRPSPLWLRVLRGIGRAGSVLLFLFGGLDGIITALIFLLPQAILAFLIVALLVVFPVKFPDVPFPILIFGSVFCCGVYLYLTSLHCDLVMKKTRSL
jgi:hypothetical protein